MYAIDLNTIRALLRDRLLAEFSEGGVFIPGPFDITSGSMVRVRVGLEGLPCGVILEGMVQWRRPAVNGRAAPPAGLGVRFLASSQERARFLAAWAAGLHPGSGRVDWRYPLEGAVTLVTTTRGSTRIYPCSLRDVSACGAMVDVSARLGLDEILRCEWRDPDDRYAVVTARVVWSNSGRVGLRMLFDHREERPAWERRVDEARSAFNVALVTPRMEERPPPGR